MKLAKLLVWAGGLAAVAAPLAHAQLIQNGGFETGDFSGWTMGGTAAVKTGLAGSAFVHTGSHGATLGAAELSQAFLTTPGRAYQVSFWMNSILGQSPGFVQATWSNFDIPHNLSLGSLSLLDTTINPVPSLEHAGWTKYSYWVVATGNVASLDLQFYTHPDTYPNNLALDDVKVAGLPKLYLLPDLTRFTVQRDQTPIPLPREYPFLLSSSITAVPEPATYGAFAALGLLLCAGVRRKSLQGSN